MVATNQEQQRLHDLQYRQLAERAWEEVRQGSTPTGDNDLPWLQLDGDFKDKLHSAAKASIETGSSGIIGLEDFDAKVRELDAPKEVKEPPQPEKESLVEGLEAINEAGAVAPATEGDEKELKKVQKRSHRSKAGAKKSPASKKK